MFESNIFYLDNYVFMLIGLLGLIACLAGVRLMRFWLALTGLQAGFLLGLAAGRKLLPDTVYPLVFALVAGILLAALMTIFARTGTTLAGGFVVTLLIYLMLLLIPVSLDAYLVYILVASMFLGMIFGVLRLRRFLILASAFSGGALLSVCVGAILAGWTVSTIDQSLTSLAGGGLALILIGTAVLTIVGTLVQPRWPKRALPIPMEAQPAIDIPQTQDDPKPLELNLTRPEPDEAVSEAPVDDQQVIASESEEDLDKA